MLILTRRVGERLMIGDDIVIKIIRIDGSSQVRIGIDAPSHVRIVREEIMGKPMKEQEAPASRAYVCNDFLATANDKDRCHLCLQPKSAHASLELAIGQCAECGAINRHELNCTRRRR